MEANDYSQRDEVSPDEQMWQELAVAKQKLLELEEMRVKIRDRLGLVSLLSITCLGLMFMGTTLYLDHSLTGTAGGAPVISLFLGLFASVASGMHVYVLFWELRKSAQLEHRLKDAVYEASANSPYAYMERG